MRAECDGEREQWQKTLLWLEISEQLQSCEAKAWV